jgi:LPS sulfotransferase NodH
MLEASCTIPEEQLLIIRYDELIKDPVAMVHHIYDHFGMEKSKAFKERLNEQAAITRKYSSHHTYSLEEYGYSREEIAGELREVFDVFGFEQQSQKKVILPSSIP